MEFFEVKYCNYCGIDHPLTKEWWVRPKQANRSCKKYVIDTAKTNGIKDKNF